MVPARWGHCPSLGAMDSVASSREEQWAQLNPYRRPVPRVMKAVPYPPGGRASPGAVVTPGGHAPVGTAPWCSGRWAAHEDSGLRLIGAERGLAVFAWKYDHVLP